LAIPGRIIDIREINGLHMGRIDFSGMIKEICLEYVPEAEPGRYVLVHAGFAISVLDEDEALQSLALWRELEEAAAEEGTDVFGMPLDAPGGDSREGGRREVPG
jgi:hydrogenase expression/formation protein HypC